MRNINFILKKKRKKFYYQSLTTSTKLSYKHLILKTKKERKSTYWNGWFSGTT